MPEALPARLVFSWLLKCLSTSYDLETSATERNLHCKHPVLSCVLGKKSQILKVLKQLHFTT